MLRHVGSCRTFVTGQLFIGGTVEVVVLARGEADGILLRCQLRLTISSAKEHEQLENKQEVSANNSVQTEPSQSMTPCRVTRDVLELWDHGQVTHRKDLSEPGVERNQCRWQHALHTHPQL